nr:MAG TPA: hypothetical protein [Caudoviricetes sp.]
MVLHFATLSLYTSNILINFYFFIYKGIRYKV